MVFLAAFSRCRKRLRSRKSLVRTSSLSCASQLSCSVSISSRSSSRCSGVSLATHASLSKGAVDSLGAPKKDVMLPLALGFLAAAASGSASPDLRLRLILRAGRRACLKKSTMATGGSFEGTARAFGRREIGRLDRQQQRPIGRERGGTRGRCAMRDSRLARR